VLDTSSAQLRIKTDRPFGACLLAKEFFPQLARRLMLTVPKNQQEGLNGTEEKGRHETPDRGLFRGADGFSAHPRAHRPVHDHPGGLQPLPDPPRTRGEGYQSPCKRGGGIILPRHAEGGSEPAAADPATTAPTFPKLAGGERGAVFQLPLGEFSRCAYGGSNRGVAGDSLLVMNSLLEKRAWPARCR
jgi:hypothetical protein